MSRRRMIDPGIWTDEGFLELSMAAKVLYIGMISNADDEGRGQAGARSLKAKIMPGEDSPLSVIETMKAEIARWTHTTFYEAHGVAYYQLEKWDSYQSINKPVASKIPAPESQNEAKSTTTVGLPEDYGSTTVGLPEDYRTEEVRRREVEEEKKDASYARDPTALQYSSTPEVEVAKPFSYSTPIPVPAATTGPPDNQWIAMEFFRRWSVKTARLVGPQNRDYQAAHELLTSLGGTLTAQLREQVTEAIGRYLEKWQDYWFARRGSPPSLVPDWSFKGFCRHYAELAETAQAGQVDLLASPEIQAQLKKIKEGAHGH